ncbi:MAG TPA: sigma-70 family RNA polymerase sigma factor [Dictyobacter sp.]|jgi:RNA polymerase sigma-70 factor (ECF subfamily)|nr:sigma-70 family RNA polymerase sigma factor [Dictyobacter sp.]
MKPSSDQELMALVCQHDAVALEILLVRYREPLFRLVLSRVRDVDAAEDVFQEMSLRVWLHADQWSGNGSVKAWLSRIAINQALNHMRSAQQRRHVSLTLPVEMAEDEANAAVPDWMIDTATPEPVQLLEQHERGQLLRQLVEGLPADKREVFHLVHDADLEIKKVAEYLHIPAGTVKSRLYYANKHLAKEWRNAMSEEGEELL